MLTELRELYAELDSLDRSIDQIWHKIDTIRDRCRHARHIIRETTEDGERYYCCDCDKVVKRLTNPTAQELRICKSPG